MAPLEVSGPTHATRLLWVPPGSVQRKRKDNTIEIALGTVIATSLMIRMVLLLFLLGKLIKVSS